MALDTWTQYIWQKPNWIKDKKQIKATDKNLQQKKLRIEGYLKLLRVSNGWKA